MPIVNAKKPAVVPSAVKAALLEGAAPKAAEPTVSAPSGWAPKAPAASEALRLMEQAPQLKTRTFGAAVPFVAQADLERLQAAALAEVGASANPGATQQELSLALDRFLVAGTTGVGGKHVENAALGQFVTGLKSSLRAAAQSPQRGGVTGGLLSVDFQQLLERAPKLKTREFGQAQPFVSQPDLAKIQARALAELEAAPDKRAARQQLGLALDRFLVAATTGWEGKHVENAAVAQFVAGLKGALEVE